MKIKLYLFLLCFFLIAGILWGQDYTTTILWPSYLTGDEWEKYPVRIKVGYIMGLLHGEILGMSNFLKTIEESNLFDEEKINLVWKVTVGNSSLNKYPKVSPYQMIVGLDTFYKDYANINIPVYKLLPLVCKRVRGEISQESIEKELQKLRSEISKLP